MKLNHFSFLAAAVLFTLGTTGASAAVVTGSLGTIGDPGSATTTGTLANNSTALEESFTLSSAANVDAFTTSYANGGFQPNLQLFNSAGMLLANQAYSTGDSMVMASLAAGSYTLLLTEFDYQLAPTVTNLGSATFVGPFTSGFGDAMGNTTTGNYALTVTSTPEPASFLLALPALAAFCLIRRKKLAVSL